MGRKKMINYTDEDIIKALQTKSYVNVNKTMNIPMSYLNKLKIKHNLNLDRKRMGRGWKTIEVDFFKTINTKKKAYWLGFICADGSISKNGNKLSIFVKDLEILEKLKQDIKSEHKLSKIIQHDKRTHKTYEEYSLQITNYNFVQNIINQGVTENKTDVLDFPKMEEKFIPAFIAGLFDGDGSVFKSSNGTIKCNLISTKEVLIFIQNFLFEKYGVKKLRINKVTKNKNNVFKMHLYKDAVRFLEIIYGDDELKKTYLQRKLRIFNENKHIKPSRQRIQPILQKDLQGNFIKKYDSIKSACEEQNYSNSVLCTAMKHRRGYAYGYLWEKINN